MKNTSNNPEDVSGFVNEIPSSFWNQLWKTGHTGWDLGQASPPIKAYIDQYQNKNAAVLIPGCGSAYEAEYLLDKGFTDITLMDIAEEAVKMLRQKFVSFPEVKVVWDDFFHHEGAYDLMLEQTFFCAQVLERRREYVKKVASILKPGGRLVGVLFGVNLGPSGPPFGGNEAEYRELFEPYFEINTMEPCYNSIAQRAGAELFINLQKK